MGMGHYERLLIHQLVQDGSPVGWQYGITFDGRTPAEKIPPETIEPGLRYVSVLGFSTGRLQHLPWSVARAAVSLKVWQDKPLLYHSLALSYPAPGTRPNVITIHDLPPARFPDEGTLPKWSRQAARSAYAILTPSTFAKTEMIDLLGVRENNVHVVYYGCEHDRFNPDVPPADAATLAEHGITGPFLIYVGGFTRRKNVSALLRAWQLLAPHYPDLSLALVGPSVQLRLLANEVDAPRVVVVGYLDRMTLPGVMKAAQALVFPSIYEGFGLPPLEAMALGVPVVAVRASAIPEVVGDAGLLAADGTPESLATAIQQLLRDDQLAQQLRMAGPARAQHFSWQDHARAVLHVYEQAIG